MFFDQYGNLMVNVAAQVGGGSVVNVADPTTPTNKLAIDGAGKIGINALPALPAGTNVIGHVIVDSGTAVAIAQPTSATATVTSVNAAAADTSLIASNTSRKGIFFYNDSTAILYLLFGTGTASTTNYTVQVPAQGFFEMPTAPVFTGGFHGIWSAAAGSVRITELS